MKNCCIQKKKPPRLLMSQRGQWIGLSTRVDYQGFQDMEECSFLTEYLRNSYPITPSIIGTAWERQCNIRKEKAYVL